MWTVGVSLSSGEVCVGFFVFVWGGVLEIPICVKMSIMWEKARSALWCISLIYYLTDFQALILSTLEEVGTPLPPFHT